MTVPTYSYSELSVAGIAFTLMLGALILLRAYAAGQLRLRIKSGQLSLLSYPERILGATSYTFMLIVSLLAAVTQLEVAPRYEKWLHYAWIIIFIGQVALWASAIILVSVERAIARRQHTNPSSATYLMIVSLVGRIALWLVAVLVTLDNLGFNVTTLMASLGIGGIAISLALQNILGDVFSSISIALDKPFSIGDFIIVEDYMGTVEYVGLKTTRIRSLGGEQIVFSNSELLKNRIRNYQLMQERRIQFGFGVPFETALENIRKIPDLVQKIILDAGHAVRFDRAHFKGFGDSALEFEVVYFMLDPDYNKYMDIQQRINLAIMERFQEMNIQYAHPTRRLYLNVPDKVVQDRRAVPANDPPHERSRQR